jgi:stage II sporulation protein D
VLEGGAEGIAYSGRRYSGNFVIDREKSDRVVLVNRVPLERYVEGVVLSEMPPNFPEEALKAQAVASRSYATWKIITCRSLSWDVADTQRSQVYRGNPELPRLAARMVRATRGLVLVSGRRPLEAVFSSTCGGTTRSAEEAFGDEAPDPLRGVVCRACDGTTFSEWRCETDRRAVGRALGVGVVTAFSNPVRHPSDRLRSIDVLGDAGARKTVAGSALQSALGSKALSTWITRVEVRGRSVVAEGRGFGHGVGMCQVGAGTLARRGADAGAILATYYPGAVVAPLWPHP